MLRFPIILIAVLFAVEAFAVRSCFIEIGGHNVLLNRWVGKPEHEVDILLRLLGELPETKTHALEFGARLSRGEITVSDLDTENGVAARTFYQDKHVSIKIDGSELGLLLVHFYHEIIHALDQEALEKLDSKDLSPVEKDKVTFKAERKAFDVQAELVKALQREFPCSENYFSEHQLKGNVLARNPTDLEIKLLYGLVAVSENSNSVARQVKGTH
ncbi:MAG: hypothetical protein KDD39_06310 [Bdellovibrionales bacterium]|nr:hypothetical protein [Bdellovibrionales bacterium]